MQTYLRLTLCGLLIWIGCKAADSGDTSTPIPGNNPTTSTPPPATPPPRVFPANALDTKAVEVTEHLKADHSPWGLTFSTLYETPTSTKIIRWDSLADSALWTGATLAAESFRYRVTKSSQAKADALRVLEAVRKLTLLNGDGVLARHFYPVNGPFVDFYLQDHAGNPDLGKKKLDGKEYYFMTRTSRDQYAGIYFGLAVAYDMLDDTQAKATIKDAVTRLTDYLLDHGWNTLNPDGSIRTSFIQMPQQQLSILQIARHVNPAKFEAQYTKLRASSAKNAWIPLFLQTQSEESSYYKFNLEHLYIYNLIRLEEANSPFMTDYYKAFDSLDALTKKHLNAHFNMVARAILGPNSKRDQDTILMLNQLIARGFRHKSVDLRGKYAACGEDRACDPVPVSERLETDFMWQTPPWNLYFPNDERREGPGVDFILPYWMSRYHGVQ
jgi:hypothetical protein